jgi:hypothetical protein
MTEEKVEYRVIELMVDPQKCNNELEFDGHLYYCDSYRNHDGQHSCTKNGVVLLWGAIGNKVDYQIPF